jgi:hypothetical protein
MTILQVISLLVTPIAGLIIAGAALYFANHM